MGILKTIAAENPDADIENPNRLYATNGTDVTTINQTEPRINDITQTSKAFVYEDHVHTDIL